METPRVNAVLDLVPDGLPVGLVIASARTYTRDYQDALVAWAEAGVPVWGTIPERVAIAAGPADWLSAEGVEAYRNVWRRLQRAVRGLITPAVLTRVVPRGSCARRGTSVRIRGDGG